VGAFLELLSAFELSQAPGADVGAVRAAAARALVRARGRNGLVAALRLAPTLPVSVPTGRIRRRRRDHAARERFEDAVEPMSGAGAAVESSLRVAVVSPEPAPYRSPVFDLLAERPDLDLTVIYAGRTIAGRTWEVEPRHPHVVLEGRSVPGAERVFHHGYPVTPGIFRALTSARPDVVVVAGWSTFPCQAAVMWCRVKGVPYVLQVESHDEGPRAGWRRAVKGSVVPPIVRGAAGVLVTGTLVRESMLARGADPAAIRLFAVTIDVPTYATRAGELRARRDELRASFGLRSDDVVVLSVARLAPEKGLDTLVEALARAEDRHLVLLVAGEGPERGRIEALARARGARVLLPGNLTGDRVAEAYVAADVFALLSTYEPWGVVVNEAAASGLPLVLSVRVGAAPDLLRDVENGALVAAGYVACAAAALTGVAADPDERRLSSKRSREIVGGWGYEPSVEGFVAAVRAAARQ
jgi:glycosyltransferase involved in cell wall biosynthesis